MAGYSGTPLARKLGIREGERIIALHAPADYVRLLAPLPEGARIAQRAHRDPRFVHLFVTNRKQLSRGLLTWRPKLHQQGLLWVSWPKKSSGVLTDVTEDVVRQLALPLGFVDIKVCAVDETWSGLKLVIRRTNRTPI